MDRHKGSGYDPLYLAGTIRTYIHHILVKEVEKHTT